MKTTPIRIASLPGSFETFGLLVDYLSRMEPFARYDLGNFSRALQHQLAEGNNLAAMAGNRLAGYCGWLPTTTGIASGWIADTGPLQPIEKAAADAVVLTVVAAADGTILTQLIRGARRMNPGKQVFFKREYAERSRQPRKSHVKNVLA